MTEPAPPIKAYLHLWGLNQDPPLFTMKDIAAKLEVSAAELSDLFRTKPRRSYHKLRKTIEEATSGWQEFRDEDGSILDSFKGGVLDCEVAGEEEPS